MVHFSVGLAYVIEICINSVPIFTSSFKGEIIHMLFHVESISVKSKERIFYISVQSRQCCDWCLYFSWVFKSRSLVNPPLC